jgi:3-methyladenine DNA glycosylase AlkD
MATTKKAPAKGNSLDEAMRALEKAGSEQTRKTYARHGAKGPMFGVSFATLKTLVKKIGVDHELALALWETGNFDARILAVKVADPAKATSADLDRWAGDMTSTRMCGGYVAMLAAEGPLGRKKVGEWLGKGSARRATGWTLLGALASLDEDSPDSAFVARIAEIEKTIASAPNAEREAMNSALIQMGCRNAALKKAALAAAKKIGTVEVDHGDTACETPDAAERIEKAWAHSKSKGFASPAEHERSREPMRTRC